MKTKTFPRKIIMSVICYALVICLVMVNFTSDMIRAEEKILYISEIMLFQAEHLEDAIKDCESKGYIPLENDLNPDTGNDFVILGYKTTEKRDEAITDLSVLQMGVGYEIRSYEEIMNAQLAQFEQLAEETFRILPAFRQNLEKGSPSAKMALQLLNYFYYDDIQYDETHTENVQMKFGDFLLSDYCDSESEFFNPKMLAMVLQRGSAVLVNLLYSTFIPAAADYNPNQAYVEGEYLTKVDQAPEFKNTLLSDISDAEEQNLLNAALPTEETSEEETSEAISEEMPEEETLETVSEEMPEEETLETVSEEISEEETSEAVSEEISEEETSEAVSEEMPEEETLETVSEETPEEETSEAVSEETPEEETSETVSEEFPEEETSETVSEEITEEETLETVSEEITEETTEEVLYHFGDSEVMLKCDRKNYGNWAERISKTGIVEMYENDEIDSDVEEAFDAPSRLIKKAIQDFAANYQEAAAKRDAYGLEALFPETSENQSFSQTAENVTLQVKNGSSQENDAALYYLQAYDILDQYRYNDEKSVAEYLVEIGSVAYLDSTEALYPFYPIAAALTDAQVYLMQLNGVAPLVMYLKNDDAITASAKDVFHELDEKLKAYGSTDGTISVWEGIDKSKYQEKFAETNQVIFKNSTGQLMTEYTGNRDNFLSDLESFISTIEFASTMIGVVSASMSAVSAIGVAMGVWSTTISTAACMALVHTGGAISVIFGLAGAAIMVISEASLVISLAILVVEIGLGIYRTHFYEEDYVDAEFKSEIPGTIIDTNDANEYLYYYPAKCSGSSDDYNDFTEEFGHGYGDLNGGEGRDDRWAALCYTKNPNTGSPLRLKDDDTCFTVKWNDGQTPSGYTALNNFNEAVPADLNAYAKTDTTIYFFYVTEDSIDQASSYMHNELNTEEQYITEMTMKSDVSFQLASDALREEGWQPVNVDLTPNLEDCVTLLGYKSSNTVTNAVTDIRILQKGGDASAVTKSHQLVGETKNGDKIYTTSDINKGSPIVADFSGIGSLSERRASYKVMMTFNEFPYDFKGCTTVNPEETAAGEESDGTKVFLTYQQSQQFLTALKLAESNTRISAIKSLTNAGYSFVDRNLTPNTGTFTYLGYKSGNASNCITDIRVLPAGVDFDTVKNYEKYKLINLTANGDVLYYSTDPKCGQPILADFGVLGSYDANSKIVSAFDNLPFDFASAKTYHPEEDLLSEEELQKIQEQGEAQQQADEAAAENGEQLTQAEPESAEKNDAVFLTYSCSRKPEYIEHVTVVSYYGNESAGKLDLQAQGYTVINKNITPSLYRTYTYIGYKTTTNAQAALTDIRMTSSYTANEYTFGNGSYGRDESASPKCGVMPQGDGLYQTSSPTNGDPILADLVIVSNPNEAPAGYEPILTFGGVPYNFNKCKLDSSSSLSDAWGTHDSYKIYEEYFKAYSGIYIYYRPSVAYLPYNPDGSEAVKYIAGITPLIADTKNNGLHDFAQKYAERNKGAVLTDVDDDLMKGTNYFPDWNDTEITQPAITLILNYTYNPKRALTDLRSYTSIPGAESLLPFYGSKVNGGYAAQDSLLVIKTFKMIGYTSRIDYWAIGFSPTHDYLMTLNTCTGDADTYNDDRTDNKREDFEEPDYWKGEYSGCDYSTTWETSKLRCKGLFGCGPVEGKEPLKSTDIAFTNNADDYKDSADWKPVVDMRTPNANVPHNLAYRATKKEGNTFYIFMHRPRPTEKKYISSVTLAVADTVAQLDLTKELPDLDIGPEINKNNYDSCISMLLSSCTDEILPRNLSAISSKYDVKNIPEYDKIFNSTPDALSKYMEEKAKQAGELNNNNPFIQNMYRNAIVSYQSITIVPWPYVMKDYQDFTDEMDHTKNVFCAYVGISRTDDKNKAIRGLLKYKPEKDFAPNTITVGGLTYTKCGTSPVIDVNETYYLYQTTSLSAGEPITAIDFNDIVYASGCKTAKTAVGKNTASVNTEALTYLHCKCDDNKGYVCRLYFGKGETDKLAAADLLNQGATYVLPLDLNEGGNERIMLGYDKATSRNDAAFDVVVVTGEQPKIQKRTTKNVTIEYVEINGEEFYHVKTADNQPLCINPADNAYLYYKKGSQKTSEMQPFSKLGVAERDRVPSNTGLVQPWEYILADGTTKYNVNQNRFVTTDGKKLTDNRVYLFGQRNPEKGIYIKSGAEITGGHCDEMMTYGAFEIGLN